MNTGLVANAVRRLGVMFPGYFEGAKHNHYKDFGYPDNLTFSQFHGMYRRNGLASGGVDKTILKTWQDNPEIFEDEVSKESEVEKQIRQRFEDLRIWQNVAEADRRSLVGGYSGLILRFADSKPFNQEADRVPGGLDGLVEVIPAWKGQLTVSEWNTDEASETYGQPLMFAFNEAAVGNDATKQRAFDLHPSRVLVWSVDGTVHGESLLQSGYNSLLDLEKISGAGGEGFWKNAKAAPVLNLDADAKIENMAKAMGVPVDEVPDKMDEQVDDWQKGFDKLLMLQGIEAKTLSVSLPSPEHFFNVSLQVFAASIPMPQKILVGSQTGERASTEDKEEWAAINMSRRVNVVKPNIRALINRLTEVGILQDKDWHISWTDLTESSVAEKVERANKMADTNQKLASTGEVAYLGEEIRAVTDLDPLTDADRLNENGDDL